MALSSCRKEDSSPSSAVDESSIQAPYFINSDEVWSYHWQESPGTPDEVNIYFKFRKLRDTTIFHAGDSFSGIVMSEEAMQYGPESYGFDSVSYSHMSTYYYDDDLRLLIQIDTAFTRMIDFKYLDYKFKNRVVCDKIGTEFKYLKSHKIEKRGKYHFNVYTNSDDQKIIEGVTIQLYECSYLADVGMVGAYDDGILTFEYSSNEYYYKWQKE